MNKHALITEKLMKDNQMSAVDKICIERFKKPFHYCHFIKDINLNGKTETLLFMGFHTDDEYLGGISFDKNNPENTSRFEVCQLYQYLMDNSNSN